MGLLFSLLASCTLLTTFLLLVLDNFRLVGGFDVLSGLVESGLRHGLDFFHLVRWRSVAFEVVGNDLLFAGHQRSLHLQGLCVRLLILLLGRVIRLTQRQCRRFTWLRLRWDDLNRASRWHQPHIWRTEHKHLLRNGWHWVGECTEFISSVREAAAWPVFALARLLEILTH